MAGANYVTITSDKSKTGAFIRCLLGGQSGGITSMLAGTPEEFLRYSRLISSLSAGFWISGRLQTGNSKTTLVSISGDKRKTAHP